jgi:hypothetical protein
MAVSFIVQDPGQAGKSKKSQVLFLSSQSLSATTLSIMTFRITTLGMNGLFATFSMMTLSITKLCYYAKMLRYIVLLNVTMLVSYTV